MNDSQIISLLQSDPRRAVEAILNRYGAALQGVILKIVGSKEVAEDILQDACIKVWKNADSYDPAKGKLFTWLLNIARNTALDKARTGKFQRQRTSQMLDQTVYDNVAFSEEMQVRDVGLQNALNKLEEKYRMIIELLYIQGYTQREIVEEFDLPLGTVKSRAKIAIRELRKLLDSGIVLLLFLAKNWIEF